ncbi:MAG: hypothetical protein GPJ29_23825 [Microcystis aeruginosa BK11-02]|nr:hypothetical protein [Microcystis aeruginosa BK11-02]
MRFLPIVFDLERANQLSLLPDKDLADLCPLIEPYQVTKNPELVETLKGVKRGLEEMKQGKGKKAEEFFSELFDKLDSSP